MEKINLLEILQAIDDYVLIKKDEAFPRYAPGTDLDLAVFDREIVIKAIYDYYNRQLRNSVELKITDVENHCHVDFFVNGELDMRIDLIDNFNFFKKFAVKPSFLVKLFKDRKIFYHSQRPVYVPSDVDDLTLRYFEYLEWFEQRPDKIKHLDYIYAMDDPDLKQRFFENTHRYIQFKPKTWGIEKGPPPSLSEAYRLMKSGARYMLMDLLARLGIKK